MSQRNKTTEHNKIDDAGNIECIYKYIHNKIQHIKIHTYIAKTIFFTLLVDMYVTVRKQVKRPFFIICFSNVTVAG